MKKLYLFFIFFLYSGISTVQGQMLYFETSQTAYVDHDVNGKHNYLEETGSYIVNRDAFFVIDPQTRVLTVKHPVSDFKNQKFSDYMEYTFELGGNTVVIRYFSSDESQDHLLFFSGGKEFFHSKGKALLLYQEPKRK